MTQMTQLIDGVRAHALEHYNDGGWDYVVEAYSDDELRAIIAGEGATTLPAAIEVVGSIVAILAERDQAVRNIIEDWQ